MKTKLWLAVMMLAVSSYTTTAAAEMVIGVKGGKVDYDTDGSEAGLNGSLQLAFDIFDIGFADIAVEGEYSTSLVDGELPSGLSDPDVAFQSTGLYASLRTVGPIYLIARVGAVKGEIEFSNGGTADDSGTATGVGVGISGGLRMELEVTNYKIEDLDINYLTVGFGF